MSQAILAYMMGIEQEGPGRFCRTPVLSPREAWLLDEFLELVHDALWETYAEEILDYEDRLNALDKQPLEDRFPIPPPGADPPGNSF